ncbi:MAG: CDP-glycerol glycerophosphotransferase family protein [Cyclobacteriaceae bacterium]|nr:CDP-glycerol glycerophosphotransferase family protein [Cyclobacteriaceae bacterium]
MPDHNNKEIALSLVEGRTVRDLFYNGLLSELTEAGYHVTIFTEATEVTAFIEAWRAPNLTFRAFTPCTSNKKNRRYFYLRRKLARLGINSILNAWIKLEEKRVYPPKPEYLDYFRKHKPCLFLATHAHLPAESELISAAHACGVPTLGIVRSWDNVYKGIKSRPQKMAVWNEINKKELMDFEGYPDNDIELVGPPQFDIYFKPQYRWDREAMARHFNLDPQRPIITFATLGYFFPGFDETCWMDVLVGLLDRKELPGDPQIICRLHPWSRLEHFEKYGRRPDIRLSYVNKYWPALTWYMDDKDMIEMGNMLAHSDVVITPGSTVTLEAAIFDRPTIVPIFHPYQQRRAKNYFTTWVLGKHFGRIQELNLVPIIKEQKDFKDMIIKCLEEPGFYAEQRQQLVRDYAHFTDGASTKRIADFALRIIENGRTT